MIQELANFIGVGEVKGMNFELIKASEIGYIFKVENNKSTHYEVFKRKLSPVCIDFEKRIYSETDFKVSYPKSNDFGIWAWTLQSIKQAEEKIKTI